MFIKRKSSLMVWTACPPNLKPNGSLVHFFGVKTRERIARFLISLVYFMAWTAKADSIFNYSCKSISKVAYARWDASF